MAAKPTKQYSNLAKPPVGAQDESRQNYTQVTSDLSKAPNATAQAPVNKATTNLAVQRSQDKDLKNFAKTDKEGNFELGTPKVYDSVGEAGSGFVNLSHLLGLNRKSGEKSAIDLANRTKITGQNAQSGIESFEDRFTNEAKAGMAGFAGDPSTFDPAGPDRQKNIDAAKNAAYSGPNDMTSMSGYADLAKKVGDAQEMAKNTQTPYGVAAQVNKETGLSPTQSAASAFYMGVNNPNIKRAGSAFTNLQSALDKANQRALDSSRFARGAAERYRANAPKWEQQVKDYDASAARTEADARARTAQAASDANQAARDQTILDNHNGRNEAEVRATSDMNWAIGKGMPAEIAYAGVPYDEWVAMGKPSWEEYQKSHPESQRFNQNG